MDIQQYIAADKELLLNLNGSQSLFWDGFMWVATSTIVWVPVAAMLLYIIIKNNKIQEALLTIVMIALVITLADQIASGLCKPFFARFRPTQDPNIMYMVDIVNGYRGGRFGFISSHAANTFAISVFLSLLIKRKSLTFMLLFWAVLNSYSRIYLGVHYPGDILFGTIEGCFIGYLIYLLYKFIQKKIFYKLCSIYLKSTCPVPDFLRNLVKCTVNTIHLSLLINHHNSFIFFFKQKTAYEIGQ